MIKTDKTNCLDNVTLRSLLQGKLWLENIEKTAYNITVPDEMIEQALTIKRKGATVR